MADHRSQVSLNILQAYSDPDYRPQNGEKFANLRRDLRGAVTNIIITAMPYERRFQQAEIVPPMLSHAMKRKLTKDQIQEAFRCLELYCLNLIHYYWKPEYSRIKRYTGVYRLKLLKVLPDVDNFIRLLGYKLDKETDTFLLTNYVSRKFLRQLAFDCFVAQTQCEFVDIVKMIVCEQMNHCQWEDVAQYMEELEGDEKVAAKLVINLCDFPTCEQPLSLINIANENMTGLSEDEDLYA